MGVKITRYSSFSNRWAIPVFHELFYIYFILLYYLKKFEFAILLIKDKVRFRNVHWKIKSLNAFDRYFYNKLFTCNYRVFKEKVLTTKLDYYKYLWINNNNNNKKKSELPSVSQWMYASNM